jgi:hypothetical protein
MVETRCTWTNFYITKGLCDQINSMVGKLFGHVKTRKIRLSWDKLTMAKKKGGLGYKDPYTFNLAMLAKQAWRLLTNPNSLCARVMKARYFPVCSIFEAQAQSGISYPWRSILKGIEVLRQGVIKRVGNGETINIWQDPWLPRPWSRRPITVRGQRVVNKVSELMDPAAGTWDEALVKGIFCAHAQLILSIPIFEDTVDDWAWHFDEKGLFSVKSAYHLQRQARGAPQGAAGGPISLLPPPRPPFLSLRHCHWRWPRWRWAPAPNCPGGCWRRRPTVAATSGFGVLRI